MVEVGNRPRTVGRLFAPPKGFSPSAADKASVHEIARRLSGRSVREIRDAAGLTSDQLDPDRRRTKGTLGAIVEGFFGIPRNQSPEPDFPGAHTELKIVPLKRRGQELVVKEPTSISMIDYVKLVDETWDGASVRKKLDCILFVFIAIDPVDLLESWVVEVALWEPSGVDQVVLQQDWTRTQAMVEAGRAHLLSESQAEALAARRKGSGGPDEPARRQPRSSELAKSRAWALRTPFTEQILQEWVRKRPYRSILEPLRTNLPLSLLDGIRGRVSRALEPFVGLSLREVGQRNGVPGTGGKNFAANVVKRSLGFSRVNTRLREFDQFGIEVRTLNLRERDRYPFEAVSFPAQDLQDLARQDWEGTEDADGNIVVPGSDLAEQLRAILFVPTYARTREFPAADRILGRPFLWEASPREIEVISHEWRMFRQEVLDGKAAYSIQGTGARRRNRLTPASRTKIIHMRPHARDSADTTLDPRGNAVTKQCFWLNKPFVWGLVKRAEATPVDFQSG